MPTLIQIIHIINDAFQITLTKSEYSWNDVNIFMYNTLFMNK